MKPSAVVALVAAGAIAGGGLATYELTKPTDSVRVNFVDPAASTATSEPTSATVTVTPTATATVTARPAAVTSSSTTRKATVRKEASVATSEPSTTETGPGRVVTNPPAPDDPIRSVAPPPVPGNKTNPPTGH